MRKSSTKWVRLGAVATTLALLAGACGGDDDDATTATTVEAAPAGDGATDTTAPAGDGATDTTAPAEETTDTTAPAEETTEPVAEPDDSAAAVAELEEAARAEGRLIMYTSQGTDVVDATIAAFREDYPDIEVEYIRLATGPLANRFASEAEAGVHEADVINLAAPELLYDLPELFLELDGSLVPAVATWPSEFLQGHFVETGMSSHIMFYNTDLVDESELPETWEDLLDDRWAGRAIVLDPRSTPTYMSFFHVMAEEYGDDFLSQFASQGFTWSDSGGSSSQQVAAGAYDAAFPVVLAHNVDLRTEGAPVAIHEIPPVHGYPHLFALPAESNNPNAGRLFLHWLLTPAGQAANCAGVYSPIIELEGSSCPPLSDDHVAAEFRLDDDRQAFILEQLELQ